MRKSSSATAPVMACQAALAYAWTGQPDLAYETLEPWIDRPAGWSLVKTPNYGDCRLNPVRDPLQGNPRFAAVDGKVCTDI